MTEKTITQNLALYHARHDRRLRQIRRELRQAQRRYWWLRFRKLFRRAKQKEEKFYVVHL